MLANSLRQGSLLGAILLISGCCIGAGMLGLPVLSAPAGFIPSLVLFFISWLFMTCTGLLLLEANLWFKDDVNIISIATRTLGNIGKYTAWILFAFLFYALMVAYISGSGELFADFYQEIMHQPFPPWIGSILCTAVLAIFLYIGTQAVDKFNRFLMLGLIASYVALVVLGSHHVNIDLLKHYDWSASFLVLPAMIISFGFHNLVPSLTTYLNRDVRKLKLAILIGSSIPLAVYILWEWLILGLISYDVDFRQAIDKGQMASQILRDSVGSSHVVVMAQYFAFFAIVTSFVGVALSFCDFLADGLGIKKTSQGKALLCLLALLPPLFFSLVYPKIFLIALSYAGAFGAVILFGILPAAMVWSGRYYKKLNTQQLVPGGKGMLLAVILFSCLIFALQFIHEFLKMVKS